MKYLFIAVHAHAIQIHRTHSYDNIIVSTLDDIEIELIVSSVCNHTTGAHF